jgi:hypothetical protein
LLERHPSEHRNRGNTSGLNYIVRPHILDQPIYDTI